jgi:hypothetical protein
MRQVTRSRCESHVEGNCLSGVLSMYRANCVSYRLFWGTRIESYQVPYSVSPTGTLLIRVPLSGSRGSCRIGVSPVRNSWVGVPKYSPYTSVCETVSTVEERLKVPIRAHSPNEPESLWWRFESQM